MRILIFQNHYEYLSRINFVSVTQFKYKRSLKLSGGWGGGGVGSGRTHTYVNKTFVSFISVYRPSLVMCTCVKIVLNKAKLQQISLVKCSSYHKAILIAL